MATGQHANTADFAARPARVEETGRIGNTQWITRVECGRRLNVSAMMVSKYARMGMPTRAEDKLVPWPAVRDWHRDNVVPQRSGSYKYRLREQIEREQAERANQGRSGQEREKSSLRSSNDASPSSTVASASVSSAQEKDSNGHSNGVRESLVAAQLRRAIAMADVEEMRAQRMRESLVDTVEVERWWGNVVSVARDRLTRIGPELGDALSRCTNASDAAGMVEQKVREVLAVLSKLG